MKIDVVMVSYGPSPFLDRFRDDLEWATETPVELHLWDNLGHQRNLSSLKNELAARGSGEWILFANPDIALSAAWDLRLIEFIESHPEIGAACPMPAGDRGRPDLWEEQVPEFRDLQSAPPRDLLAKVADRREWDHRNRMLAALAEGRLPSWNRLTDDERAAVSAHPEFARIGAAPA